MTRPPTDFHPALRIVHWLMAALILAMLFIGVGMVSTTGPLYPVLLAWHRPVGIAILVLVLFRLPLRLATGAPALPGDMSLLETNIAKASHVLLYASMAAMPLIGWAMLSAGGYPVRITQALALPAIAPHNLALYAILRSAHTIIALLFFALILGHLAAALLHGLVRKDGVFRAMTVGHKLPKGPEAGPVAPSLENRPDIGESGEDERPGATLPHDADRATPGGDDA